ERRAIRRLAGDGAQPDDARAGATVDVPAQLVGLVVEVAAERLVGEVGAELEQRPGGWIHVVVARVERHPRAEARAGNGDGIRQGLGDGWWQRTGAAVDRGLDPHAAVAQAEEDALRHLEQELRR